MPEKNSAVTTEMATPVSAADHNAEVRRLLHDMNNGLEIIIQATYLISTLEMKEDGKQWVKLLEGGVDQVAKLNLKLRDLIRNQQA